MPLALLPEEVVLLVENGIPHLSLIEPRPVTQLLPSELAVIINDQHAHPNPSPSALKKYNDERIETINLQISHVEAKEANAAGRAMSEESLRKRKAREEKKASMKAKVLAAAPTENADPIFVPGLSKSTSWPSTGEVASPTGPATPAYTVITPVSSCSLPWYTPHQHKYTTLALARAAGVWTYPSTLHERAKCGVFRGLWEQGYFMGGGIKFGGDYLVYPGA